MGMCRGDAAWLVHAWCTCIASCMYEKQTSTACVCSLETFLWSWCRWQRPPRSQEGHAEPAAMLLKTGKSGHVHVPSMLVRQV